MRMPSKRSWSDQQLIDAVAVSRSYRNVLLLIGLVPAGGNYEAVKKRIQQLRLDTTHFMGKGWNREWTFDPRKPAIALELVLVEGRSTQSYKLKKRLFLAGMKQELCELCGWAERSEDGRIPLELDHINGRHDDNRIENLRILCPNCHSLQPTHRGKNKGVNSARVL